MGKRDRSRPKSGPRRLLSAALREQGLLFRCGHGAINDLACTGDGLLIFTATGALRYEIPAPAGPPGLQASYECPTSCAAWAPSRLVLALHDLRCFDEGGQTCLEGHRGRILQVLIDPGGERLISLGEDELMLLYLGGEAVRQLALGPQPRWAAPDWDSLQASVGYADGRVELWDLRSGLKLRSLTRLSCGVRRLWRSASQLLLLDEEGCLWRYDQDSLVRLAASVESITSVHITSSALYVGNEMGEICRLDAAGQQVEARWEAHGEAICALTGPPDGSWLASACYREPRLWLSPEETLTFDFHEEILAQAVSPQGRWLACGDGEGHLVLRSLDDGHQVKALEGHSDCITSLAFRPDEGALASGSADGLIMVWEPRKGELITTLDGHDDSITALLYEPAGQLLISGASDGLVIIWHPDSEQAVTQLSGFDSGVVNLTLARRGEILVAHYEGGFSLAWDLTRWQ